MTRSTAFGGLMLGALTIGCGPTETTDNLASTVATRDPAAARSIPSSLEAGLPTAAPGAVGMSEEGLARIRPAMEAYIEDGRLAGVMTMVARRGHVVHWDAVGLRDIEAR